MSSIFTVVSLLAVLLTVSCRGSSRGSQQIDLSEPELVQLSEVITGEEIIKIPSEWLVFLGSEFQQGAFMVRKTLDDHHGPANLKSITWSVSSNFDHILPSQQRPYREKLNHHMDTFDQVEFFEGKIYPKKTNSSDPNLDSHVFHHYSLVRYKQKTGPQQFVSKFYGMVELAHEQALMVYGDKTQLKRFVPAQNYSENEVPYTHSYQALFTDSFDQAYQQKGLLIILGSYMAQRLLFKRNLNVRLELGELVYKGKDIDLSGFVPGAVDINNSEIKKDRFSMIRVHEFGKNIDRFAEKSFSLLYTNHSQISQFQGSQKILGLSYENQICENTYGFKSMWVKPFIETGREGHLVYGQYILDSHEISHMFGASAQHYDKVNGALMNTGLIADQTYFEYFKPSGNIAAMNKTKRRSLHGKCATQSLPEYQPIGKSNIGLRKRAQGPVIPSTSGH